MLDKNEVEQFIATLKYPRFAAYVVNQLVKKYGVTREEATEIWNERQER